MEVLEQAVDFVADGVPSYTEALAGIIWGIGYCHVHCNESDSYSPANFLSRAQKHMELKSSALVHVILLIISWTSLKLLLTVAVFKPLVLWVQVDDKFSAKFTESLWKFFTSIGIWCHSSFILFGMSRYSNVFYNPNSTWKQFSPTAEAEPIIYWLFMSQISYYFHCIYAMVVMDTWRKDYWIMVFHHILCIVLALFCFLGKGHVLGTLIFWLHDVSDILLEFTKCNFYLKTKSGSYHKLHDVLASIGFFCFGISWFVCRLYWYPLKILYSTGYGSMVHFQTTPTQPRYYFFCNALLWLLLLLNIYWFMLIIRMCLRLILGQMDDRERDENMTRDKNDQQAKTRNRKHE